MVKGSIIKGVGTNVATFVAINNANPCSDYK